MDSQSSLMISFLFIALSFSSFDLISARRLLQSSTLPQPTIPNLPKPIGMPPIPSISTTLPQPGFPKSAGMPPMPLQSIPTTLPQPKLPNLPKPAALPPMPTMPTTLPQPTVPSLPKPTVFAIPPMPKIPGLPNMPTTMPYIPFFSPPSKNN